MRIGVLASGSGTILEAILDESCHIRGFRKARLSQRHAHREHLAGAETGIDGTEGEKRANEQCRPHHQHQCQSNLTDHEECAPAVQL